MKNRPPHSRAHQGRIADQATSEPYQNLQERTQHASQAQPSQRLLTSLKDMEVRRKSAETQSRLRSTLDAFTQIARYLAGIPGIRIFSGSRVPSLSPSFAMLQRLAIASPAWQISIRSSKEPSTFSRRIRSLSTPFDSRGLDPAPSTDRLSSPDAPFVGSPSRLASSTGSTSLLPEDTLFAKTNAEEHATMEQIAYATGGLTLFNTNDLVSAVNQPVQHGAIYYTLTYVPSDLQQNAAFRSIHLSLRRPGLRLATEADTFPARSPRTLILPPLLLLVPLSIATRSASALILDRSPSREWEGTIFMPPSTSSSLSSIPAANRLTHAATALTSIFLQTATGA